jgi:hypothetical protein
MTALTTHEVNELVYTWYKKLDVHAPMVDILPMLAEERLYMVFPEATLEGLASFESWYQGVIRIFFDEVHKVKKVTSVIKKDKAEVRIIVHWEASKWNPPARFSDRIKVDAYQTWKVKRSAKTGRAVVIKYIVDKLVYTKDSAKL